MKSQFTQDYDVDNRSDQTEVGMPGSARIKGTFNNAGLRDPNEGVDNAAGARYLKRYIERKRNEDSFTSAADQATEGRFIVAGPGNSIYGFRNSFRASK